ncbi:unnamed protein product [Hymenolepis diminuta]|uniref:Reverse transcriptase domain-containing protein n=1 Tax=Hymenolepis diminuta TaxID=6216 RepID=A0A564YNP1_HYMDI|nr:unnamed protein product [Hymenolepis diminuta]
MLMVQMPHRWTIFATANPADIFSMLSGGECFAKFDFAEAYMQIKFVLLTSKTHRGHSQLEFQESIIVLLCRIQKYGFRLRTEKFVFLVLPIKCLVCVFNENDSRPDPGKPQTITEMPRSRSFMNLINSWSILQPPLHNIRPPLNKLVRYDTKWNLTPTCEKAFTRLKDTLHSDMLLSQYSPILRIVVASYALNYGADAIISHVFLDSSE